MYDLCSEPLQSADCLRSGQLFEHRVTGQNAVQCSSAIRDKVLRDTRKIHNRYRKPTGRILYRKHKCFGGIKCSEKEERMSRMRNA
jgi:hypothetical protein